MASIQHSTFAGTKAAAMLDRSIAPSLGAPTRRTMMNMIVSAAALATAGAVSTTADSHGADIREDAQLIELNHEYSLRLLPALTASNQELHQHTEQIFAEVWEWLPDDFPEDQNMWTREQRQLFFDTWREVDAIQGDRGIHNRNKECWERCDMLVKKLLAIPTSTVRGFAIKASVIAFHAFRELWDQPLNELDYDRELTRLLLEQLAKAGGQWVPLGEALA
jgi:hypothetical protein